MGEKKLDEAVTDAWQQYQATLDALPLTQVVVQKAFEIGFAEGCYYTVRRLQIGTSNTEPKPPHQDIS